MKTKRKLFSRIKENLTLFLIGVLVLILWFLAFQFMTLLGIILSLFSYSKWIALFARTSESVSVTDKGKASEAIIKFIGFTVLISTLLFEWIFSERAALLPFELFSKDYDYILQTLVFAFGTFSVTFVVIMILTRTFYDHSLKRGRHIKRENGSGKSEKSKFIWVKESGGLLLERSEDNEH